MLVELVSEQSEYGHEGVICQSCWLDMGSSGLVCLALFVVSFMTGSFGVMRVMVVRHELE